MALAAAVVLAAVVALAAAVAGQPSAENLRPVVAPQQAAVRLKLTVTTARPGDPIGLIVVNDTSSMVLYGLATTVERRHEGRWINAMRAVYPRNHVVPSIGFLVPPHGQGGPPPPRGRGLRDEIVLPDNLRPGRYRASKRVTVGDINRVTAGDIGETRLRATFRVRR